MKTSYIIENQQLVLTESTAKLDLVVFNNYTLKDEEEFIEKFNLHKSIFNLDDNAPIAPRYEKISSPILGETLIVALSNIQAATPLTTVEERLETHLFILGEKQLFWFNQLSATSMHSDLIDPHFDFITSRQSILLYFALLSSQHFKHELEHQKEQIQYLKQQADRASNIKLISKVAHTEQDLVILEHTIDSQDLAIRNLLNNSDFIADAQNDGLVWDVKENNRLVKHTIHMYRDLLETVSNLYSDIISNNLNQTMRYLNSISIIIAISALIASLWGMNTGGLPFKDHPFGTFIMIFVAVVAGLIMYLILKKKDFFKD